MIQAQTNVAPEIAACVGEGRDPTVQELGRLADRVRREIWGTRSAFAWTSGPGDTSIRLASFRIAHAALVGVPSDHSFASDQVMMQPAATA